MAEEERREEPTGSEGEQHAGAQSKKQKQKKVALYAGLGIVGIVLLVLAYRYYENNIAGQSSSTGGTTGPADDSGAGGAAGGGSPNTPPPPTAVDYGPDFAALEAELAALQNRTSTTIDIVLPPAAKSKTPSTQVPGKAPAQTALYELSGGTEGGGAGGKATLPAIGSLVPKGIASRNAGQPAFEPLAATTIGSRNPTAAFENGHATGSSVTGEAHAAGTPTHVTTEEGNAPKSTPKPTAKKPAPKPTHFGL